MITKDQVAKNLGVDVSQVLGFTEEDMKAKAVIVEELRSKYGASVGENLAFGNVYLVTGREITTEELAAYADLNDVTNKRYGTVISVKGVGKNSLTDNKKDLQQGATVQDNEDESIKFNIPVSLNSVNTSHENKLKWTNQIEYSIVPAGTPYAYLPTGNPKHYDKTFTLVTMDEKINASEPMSIEGVAIAQSSAKAGEVAKGLIALQQQSINADAAALAELVEEAEKNKESMVKSSKQKFMKMFSIGEVVVSGGTVNN